MTEFAVDSRPPAERLEAGKALRKQVARSAHAAWRPAVDRADPIAVLRANSRGRLKELLPIRWGRMLASPFAFLRGAAAVMATDLAPTPVTGLRVQAGGDCHLANFGGFATPERHLVFDVNDFDETLPAPWEWDLKRLAASVVVAGRHAGISDKAAAASAQAAVRSYREMMIDLAGRRALDVWYARLDFETLVRGARDPLERRVAGVVRQARRRTMLRAFPKLVEMSGGAPRIKDDPPLIFHSHARNGVEADARAFLRRFRKTLTPECRVIFDRFRLVDVAMKVVGVGSVGTRCAVALLQAADDDPLFLQIKEARPSVLEPFAGKSPYSNQGERVVRGQHLMQSASDIFLGWSRDDKGRDYYCRQLRDIKVSIVLDGMTAVELTEYAGFCGRALARAHARSGDAATLAGYMGGNDVFDRAVAKLAVAYADQTERDYEALQKAVKAGRLRASVEKG
ncbi:MAG TPA: DUF2252 domain-containing protein [Thermoanaerobaculia bacterium]|jgi:uncharacterized protein (DUF2252 family)|nr:DUF2252 domain-containing protein [Thermoanaerobaculia bacterium]